MDNSTTSPLDHVVNTFRSHLHLPDPVPLVLALATVVANRIPGDPVWLMLVGPPSSGKSEIVNALRGVKGTHAVSAITEPALLSASPRRDRGRNATGGLLQQVGDYGILLLKDFTSILAMHPDKRAGPLAALREIFDGSWTRHVGVDGGRQLSWQGKLGMIAACTEAVDRHHAVVASMGERFLLVRMTPGCTLQEAQAALRGTGREEEMRTGFAQAVEHALAPFDEVPAEPASPPGFPAVRLMALASLAARCRSAVEREGYRREVVDVPQPERPARLVRCLRQLFAALCLLGATEDMIWRALSRAALDSMPAVRRRVFDYLVGREGLTCTSTLVLGTGLPETAARRGLEDLAAHGVLERVVQGNVHSWRPSASTTQLWALANRRLPEGEEEENV